ncbi:hypothetical protein [Achromobacter xylosoxidans]|uniref:hypothetical protein n=1 Tax=Alcaligenes xylosoxydans xylosoxydans TaxID=85698 RepID=UPI003D2BFC5D
MREWRADAGPDDPARLRAWSGPGSDDAPFDPQLANEALPSLGYLPLTGGLPSPGPGAADMMRWQALGQGRIGIVSLADSWQLPLAGRADLHGELWSAWAATLARPGRAAVAGFRGEARIGERVALCDLDVGARVLAPGGSVIVPMPDPAADGCAGLWPRAPGWHRIDGGGVLWVRGVDDAPGVQAASLQAETRRLAGAGTGTQPLPPPAIHPVVWFLVWLLVTALLWTLHRARRGCAPLD